MKLTVQHAQAFLSTLEDKSLPLAHLEAVLGYGQVPTADEIAAVGEGKAPESVEKVIRFTKYLKTVARLLVNVMPGEKPKRGKKSAPEAVDVD
jgi:hypothetical protein